MNIEKIRSYAKLIAKVGTNPLKGQDVMLTCDIEVNDFAHLVVEEFYKLGVRKVFVDYIDNRLAKLNCLYQDEEAYSVLESFEIEKQAYIARTIPCRVYLESYEGNAMEGIDIGKYSRASSKKRSMILKYRDIYDNKCQWCIAGVPTRTWAKEVFPNLSDEEAYEALWEAILKTSRALEGDPIENWRKHDENIREKAKLLNDLNLRKLIYHSKNGTDFWLLLNEKCKWLAGGEETSESKVYFQPNIPTEEVFTTPIAGKCEGVVVATKPLILNGQVVENFKIWFKNGKVEKVEAEKGLNALEELIKMDEGSAMLGECALVPYSSPINQTNLIFKSTLFDENACCHLALGRGFENLLEGYEKMTKEEIIEAGINYSLNHVDFMIGSEDLSIIGIDKSGKEIEIFKDGEWAI